MSTKNKKRKLKSIIQTTTYTCWAVSILNVLNFFWIEHSFSEMDLSKLTKAEPDKWCENDDLADTICLFKDIKTSVEACNWTLDCISKELTSWKVCLVNYFNVFSNCGHYAVIIDQDEYSFYLLDSVLWDLRLKKETFQKFWHNGDKTVYWWYLSIENN